MGPLAPTPSILILQENGPVRNLLAAILRHVGYRVHAARSEREGTRILAAPRHDIGLIIVDQSAPEIPLSAADGAGPAPKYLYLTAFRSLPEKVADALAHPESGFLAKPFSPKSLLDLVEALIGRPEGALEAPAPTVARAVS
jgi:DNA-binding response OmpR family regulator